LKHLPIEGRTTYDNLYTVPFDNKSAAASRFDSNSGFSLTKRMKRLSVEFKLIL